MTTCKPPLRQKFEDEQCCAIWQVKDLVRLDDRWRRARAIVSNGHVTRDNGHFNVRSQSRDLVFTVRLGRVLGAQLDCECEDYRKWAPWGWCKHKIAAWIYSQLTEAQLQHIPK